ncbi:MAG TPA: efflux RND transporter periplasmic adaptor subunit [Gammaproteobacteria bacterium]|jgi:HlyD family secretion protein|nr:efflux RND transporter periplasmic adaptor subunit [Gammaproteobacteria bacterium]
MNTDNLKKIVKIRDTASQDVAIDNKPRLRRRRWYLLGGSAALLLVLVLLAPAVTRMLSADASVSASRLSFATVERGPFVNDIAAEGKVVAAVSPTLYATSAGSATVKVNAGDTVKKGQILVVIDSPELTSQFGQESSTLSSMETDLERERINAKKAALKSQETMDLAGVKLEAATREMKRADAAWGFHVISAQDYEKAKDDLAAAKLEYAHAQADTKLDKEGLNFDVRTKELQVKRQHLLVQDLQRQVNDLNVRSPINGQVGQILIAPRATVPVNAQLLTVIDLSALEVEVTVPESFARDLGVGMATDITGNGGEWKGEVSAISPEVVNGEVAARVRFEGDKPQNLRQNQRLSVRIVLDKRDNVLTVARGSFVDESGGRYAYVVHDGIAVKTPIRIGATSIDKVEILQGLKAGDRIVISGTDSFNGAARVAISN